MQVGHSVHKCMNAHGIELVQGGSSRDEVEVQDARLEGIVVRSLRGSVDVILILIPALDPILGAEQGVQHSKLWLEEESILRMDH